MKEYDETLLLDGSIFLQEKEGFRFGHDIVLLADFIRDFAKKDQINLEIGTGNGILPVLLKKRDFSSKSYLALDILESNVLLAKKNMEIQEVEAEVFCCDVKHWEKKNYYSQIFANPPYMTVDGKFQNEKLEKAIARHELYLNLEDFVKTVKKLLRPIGSLYLVHRSHRLQELLVLFAKYDFSVSKIYFVYHEGGKLSNLVLMEVYKGKKTKCDILEPRYIK